MSEEPKGIQFPRLYDLLISWTTRGRQRQYRQDLIDRAGLQPGVSLLDVGCGTGSFATAAWSHTQPGGTVCGVDVSEEMLRAAKRKNLKARSEVAFKISEATNLPFQDETFDVVTMITALHAIPPSARDTCLAEMVRVLRPGGRLLLVDFAGKLEARRHWIATHGAHGDFDLYAIRPRLLNHSLGNIQSEAFGWMDLGYLKAEKRAA